MTALVALREKIKEFYGQFSGILNICGRFLLSVFVFLFINREIGMSPIFTNMFVILIMALIASIMNLKVLIFLSAVVIAGNVMTLGYDVLLVTIVFMLLLLVLFVIYVPDDSPAVIFMPLAIALGIPAIVPITCGLKRSPASIAALCPGILIHYYLLSLGESAEAIRATKSNEYVERIELLLEPLLGNRMIILYIFAVSATVILVYAIRKLRVNYSFEIAVGAGGVLFIVMALVSNSALEIGADVMLIIVGTIVSVAMSYIYLFFVHHVDYAKSENLTFEDDDYYYYVKAIPKIYGAPEEKYSEEESGDGEASGDPASADRFQTAQVPDRELMEELSKRFGKESDKQ